MYQQHIENILTYINTKYPEELDRARRWFFENTGEAYEGDEFYENRIANHLEWFVFDWDFNDTGKNTAAFFLQSNGEGLSDEDRQTLDAFTKPLHSIFEIKKLIAKENKLVLLDLFSKKKYEVFERRSIHGIERKNIFEGRLIEVGDKTVMMQAFVLHPQNANSFIKKHIKHMLKEDCKDFKPFMVVLQKMWVHMHRYSKVDTKKIYSEKFLEEYFHGGKLPQP